MPYGSKLTPVKHCLQRLYETEHVDLTLLLACKFASDGLKTAAIASQPERIEQRKRDLITALDYELERYDCLLLDTNPYAIIQFKTLEGEHNERQQRCDDHQYVPPHHDRGPVRRIFREGKGREGNGKRQAKKMGRHDHGD